MTFETILSGKIACDDAVAGVPTVAYINAIAGVLLMLLGSGDVPVASAFADDSAMYGPYSHMKLTVQWTCRCGTVLWRSVFTGLGTIIQ
jgi:hypothetical protein